MATTVLIAERLALEDAVRELLVTASATGVYLAIVIFAMFIIVNINMKILTATRPLVIINANIKIRNKIIQNTTLLLLLNASHR